MKSVKKNVVILIFLMISISLFSQESQTVRLFYLGGQSNMDGYGYNAQLPDSLNRTFENTFIFHGNSVADNEKNGGSGQWSKLRSGHGVGFSSDGDQNNYSDRFGVELSFAYQLQKYYPNEMIAIIKYSRGGTSIDSLASYGGSWEPDYQGVNGINQYDNFLNTVKNAMTNTDINGNGINEILIPQGIIWMQGESDAAFSDEVARNYQKHLKRLMDLMRAAFRVDDLPVVIGRISDSFSDEDGKVWDYLELVQYAQEEFVKKDQASSIVRQTSYYSYSDPWHYDTIGYIDLGTKFAKAIHDLNIKN